MNKFKRISSLILALLMFATLNSFSLMAYAQEQGTKDNPYQITTAQELQNINDNVSAHYKLMADIDLNNMDFTPIGNADSGAFSGSFDGNGHTISNLNVFSGKYAGLFGCNEGTIKNVTLKDIYVYGSRYLGGVVAENTSLGTIADCKVLSGKIESDGGLSDINAGGICGSNNGNFEGEFSNGADLEIKSNNASVRAGGIIGWNSKNFNLIAYNTGNVSSFSSGSSSYSGGLIGCENSKVTIINNYNTGNVSSYSHTHSYAGGLIGAGYSEVIITNSYNTGNIYSQYNSFYYSHAGGLLGTGVSKVTIVNSYNTGNVTSNAYQSQAGGLIGEGNSTLTIANSYNTGMVSCAQYYSPNIGGLVGARAPSLTTITNSYISNNIEKRVSYDLNNIRNSYQLQSRKTYVGWDFDEIWTFDSKINNGYPVLSNAQSPLQLSKSNANFEAGKTYNLIAYKNGKISTDVVWSVTNGNSTVNSQGVVTAGTGMSTITATDSEGNKANCNIYAFTPGISVVMKDKTINISYSSISNDYSIEGGSGDYIVDFKSSDESIVEVDYNGALIPKSVGMAIVTATTAGGTTGTQKITVVNSATEISLSNSSMTIARGTEKQLTAITNPSPTSSKITWKSSDENVAVVDQNGNVTGVNTGSATITATTDNGYSATCSVTINAPITSMDFDNPSITIYKNDVQKLNLVYSPSDTTDTISYSSSKSSNLYVDSTGTITAKYKGTYKITATASSGVKAYCTVKVIDYPVVVTDITLDQTEHNMLAGEVFKLNATVTPSNATDKTVIWTSTDETIATVSQGGTVEAKGAGKAVITATTQNGIIAYCVVNVTGVASTNLSKIYVPDVLDSSGEYVDIPVMIENNPGISFASLTVQYNSDELEPLEVKNGDIFESILGNIDKDNCNVKLYFTSDKDIAKDGILAKIRCRVLNKDNSPQIKLCYFPSEIRNSQAEAVAFNLVDGAIDINEHTHTYGEWIYNGDAEYISSSNYKNGTQTRTCSVCGEKETVEAPNTALLRRRGNALALESSITLTTYITKDVVDYYDEVYAEFTRNGKTEVVRASDKTFKSGSTVYNIFDYAGISPQAMGDDVEVVFYGIKDGVRYWGNPYSISAASYIQTMLNTSTSSAKLKTMLVDLLYYGEACQLYQNYKTNNLLTDILTDEQKQLRSTEELSLNNIRDSAYETCENRLVRLGSALRLSNAVEMAIPLNMTDVTLDELTIKVKIGTRDLTYTYADNPENFKKEKDGYWYFYFDGIYANQMSNEVLITAYRGEEQVSYTLKYSVESYAATVTDSKLKKVTDAMMRYGNSAKAYSGK